MEGVSDAGAVGNERKLCIVGGSGGLLLFLGVGEGEPLFELVGQVAAQVVEIMVHHRMRVQVVEPSALVVLEVDVLAAVVLAAPLARGEEDGVVLHLRAAQVRRRLRVVVPLLEEQDAGLGPGVRFEGVPVQAHHGQDAGVLSNKVADGLVARVVHPALRQHYRHAPAGL